MRIVIITGLAAALLIAAAAPAAAATAIPAVLQAWLTSSAAAMADPDSIEPSRQVDLARAHLALCVAAWGPASPKTALCEIELGRALLTEMFPVEAKRLLTDAIGHLGLRPELRARAQSLLAEALERLGEYGEAQSLLVAALTVQTSPADRAITLRQQARVFISQFKPAEAAAALAAARQAASMATLPVYEQANLQLVSGLLAYAKSDPNLAVTEITIGLQLMEARYNQADSRLGYALDHLGMATAGARGLLAAEPVWERALAVERGRPRPNPDRVASALSDLASAMGRTGRASQAVALMQEAIALTEAADRPWSLARRLNNLGQQLSFAGRFAEAVPVLERALAITNRLQGENSLNAANTLQILSNAVAATGDAVRAQAMATQLVALRERAFGTDHVLSIVARMFLANTQIAKAPSEAARSLAIAATASERRFGSYFPLTLTAQSTLASALADAGDDHAALAAADKVLQALAQPELIAPKPAAGRPRTPFRLEFESGFYEGLLDTLFLLGERGAPVADQVFAVMQVKEAMGPVEALAWRSAARASLHDPQLQALAEQQRAGEARLVRLRRTLNSAADPLAATARINHEQTEVNALFDAIASRDAGYGQMARRTQVPLGVLTGSDAAILKPGEALLVYTQSRRALLAAVVTGKNVQLVRLPATGREAMTAQVLALRQQLLIENALTAADLPAFGLAAAHDLHNRVIAPLLPHLRGITTLHVVADGPIARLPLALLVAKPGTSKNANARYRRTKWLGDRFALVSQPGISAFAAARSIISPSRADRPVLAVADPALTGTMQVAGLAGFARLRGNTRGVALATRNAAAICAMQPLPDTRREAIRLAQTLKGGGEALLLGEAASESAVRALAASGELARYRTLLFATHGLAGVENSGEEPALILKPASCAATNDEDDGLLAASEIATLKLDADLVILSGCNTAAPGDALAGEPFSGLAQAFRYAGARRLLVSHWSVDSAATADFMASLFANRRPVTATSLQSAMQAMRHSHSPLAYRSHPAFWAPFVLVGDSR